MRYVVVTRSARLNVRAKPGIQFPKVGSLASGDEVEVTYRRNGWAQLERGGWVSMHFLRPVTATQSATGDRASSQRRGPVSQSSSPRTGPSRATDRPPTTPIEYSYYSARRGLVLAPRHNSPDKHDATGAFIPGARRFMAWHETVRFPRLDLFNNAHETGGNRDRAREEVLTRIREAPGPLDIIAYFGHGVEHGLPTAGVSRRHIGELADTIRRNTSENPVVLLYACSAGRMGGLAQQLQEAIGKGVVYSHSTAGHTYRNPFVTKFPERIHVVDPSSSLFRRWRRKLDAENLWLRFWMFSVERLHAALDSGVDTRRLVAR